MFAVKPPPTCLLLCAFALVALCLSPLDASAHGEGKDNCYIEGDDDYYEGERDFYSSKEDLAAYLLANPNLFRMQIDSCPTLKNLPPLPSSLSGLRICQCSSLTSLPELPNTLLQLRISNCPLITTLPDLPASLTELSIKNCCGLRVLPKLPKSLMRLHVQDCPTLKSLPPLPRFLTDLNVNNCPGIRRPPAPVNRKPPVLTKLDNISASPLVCAASLDINGLRVGDSLKAVLNRRDLKFGELIHDDPSSTLLSECNDCEHFVVAGNHATGFLCYFIKENDGYQLNQVWVEFKYQDANKIIDALVKKFGNPQSKEIPPIFPTKTGIYRWTGDTEVCCSNGIAWKNAVSSLMFWVNVSDRQCINTPNCIPVLSNPFKGTTSQELPKQEEPQRRSFNPSTIYLTRSLRERNKNDKFNFQQPCAFGDKAQRVRPQ
jgi:hypothetical protein